MLYMHMQVAQIYIHVHVHCAISPATAVYELVISLDQ